LLAAALEFAAREPGSLQKFVFAVREAGAEIKREAEAGGEVIRIMTVHGAKGLQAPLVILPDTVGLPQFTDKLFWLAAGQGREVPLYGFTKDGQPRAIAEAVNRERAAKLEEYNRLLYVALTRAEDELLICGAKPARALPEACWYESIRRGFDALEVPAGPDGVRLMATPQTAPPDRAGGLEAAVSLPDLPAWAGAAPDWLAVPPRLETARPEPLAPSRNTEDEAKRAIAASPLGQMLRGLREARAAALAKGRMVHALLQHLPEIAQGARVAAADSYLAHAARELPAPVRARIRQSVMNILEDERLAPLFGPGSRAEAPVAGVVAGFEIGGLIDRLAIGEAEILLADYKTDRAPPPAPEHIPPGYLRQLAAYRALLSQIHPTHQIKCILIWTESAVPMEVPSELLDAHAPQAEAVQAEMG
jgi:ATP-dependent helicase/nuclease subunit A